MKLEKLKNTLLYDEVIREFADTFQVLKSQTQYFGVPDRLENKVDDAVFFSKDSTDCLMIVLQRNNARLMFGNARMIHGHRQSHTWKFKVGLDFGFSRDYFELYKYNDFQKISLLARYAVLTDGNVTSIDGCEIDEHFWFIELNR